GLVFLWSQHFLRGIDLVTKGQRNIVELLQAFNLWQVPAVIKQSDLNIRQRTPQYFRMFRRDEIVLLAPNYQGWHLHLWKYGIQGIDVSAGHPEQIHSTAQRL